MFSSPIQLNIGGKQNINVYVYFERQRSTKKRIQWNKPQVALLQAGKLTFLNQVQDFPSHLCGNRGRERGVGRTQRVQCWSSRSWKHGALGSDENYSEGMKNRVQRRSSVMYPEAKSKRVWLSPFWWEGHQEALGGASCFLFHHAEWWGVGNLYLTMLQLLLFSC